MKVLFHLHKYVPMHNAGAEYMAHAIARWLVGRGHDCKVLSLAGEAMTHQGVEITIGKRDPDLYDWADVVVTHLDVTQVAMREARHADRPVVHLLHNDAQLRFHRVRPADAQLVVYNSQWLARAVAWRGPSVIVRPPVAVDDYRVQRGRRGALTLINLTKAKGADVLWELAERLPRERFIAVIGAYGEQSIPKRVPRNVDLRRNTADIRSIYADTRVLLMPSSYESWGRTALEAACSGIPTIAHPAPGLVESLGPAGNFVDREIVPDWVSYIRMLDEPEFYGHRAAAAVARSMHHDHEADLVALEKALVVVIDKGRERPVRYAR